MVFKKPEGLKVKEVHVPTFTTEVVEDEPHEKMSRVSHTHKATQGTPDSPYVNSSDLNSFHSTFRPSTPGVLDLSLTSQMCSLTTRRRQAPGRFDGLADLYEIKKKLAKHNIPCTMRTLEVGLVKPTDLASEQLNSLPTGRELLMEHPGDEEKR
jgi:hypothetical protein